MPVFTHALNLGKVDLKIIIKIYELYYDKVVLTPVRYSEILKYFIKLYVVS